MKQISFFSLLFSLFMLHTRCNKDKTFGEMTAVKDGAAWNAKPHCQNSFLDEQLLDFSSQVLSLEGYLREEIGIASIPKKTGFYKFSAFDPITFGGSDRKQCTVTYATLVGDGLAEGLWTVAPNDTVSYLEITEVSNKILKGKFAVTLLLTADSKLHYPYLKDTVIFTDGYFNTEIEN